MHTPQFIAAACLSFVLVRSSYAGAQTERDAPARKPVDESVEFGGTVDGWMGGGSVAIVDGKTTGALATGATGLLQYKWFDAGVGVTAAGPLFEGMAYTVSALAGARIDPVPWFRVETLAEGGVQEIESVSGTLFGEVLDSGRAALPYVGGRASFSFLIGRSHRLVLGTWTNAGTTIGHENVTATIDNCFLGCSVTTEQHRVYPKWIRNDRAVFHGPRRPSLRASARRDRVRHRRVRIGMAAGITGGRLRTVHAVRGGGPVSDG